MSDMQVAAVQRKGWSFWAHLALATVLSFIMPYLGSAYLGLKSSNKAVEWQRKSTPLSAAMFAVLALPFLLNFSLVPLIFFSAIWALVGIGSVVVLWRGALRLDANLDIAPGGFTSLIFAINILLFAAIGDWPMNWPEISLFRAPESTPVVAAGDLLYGFKYAPDRIRLQRGQLILANVDGENALVRVLAVPGDIFALGENTIYLNGFTMPAYIQSEFGWADARKMREILSGIEAPGDRSRPANLMGNMIALDGAVPDKAEVLGPASFVVARDTDLLRDGKEALKVYSIGPRHILSVPWARLWSWADHPGARSDLAQPMINITE